VKPVVHYHDCMPPALGEPARVFPMDHPRASNTTWVRTTRVVALIRDTSRGPVFETRNTRYEPASDWKPTYQGTFQHAYA